MIDESMFLIFGFGFTAKAGVSLIIAQVLKKPALIAMNKLESCFLLMSSFPRRFILMHTLYCLSLYVLFLAKSITTYNSLFYCRLFLFY